MNEREMGGKGKEREEWREKIGLMMRSKEYGREMKQRRGKEKRR